MKKLFRLLLPSILFVFQAVFAAPKAVQQAVQKKVLIVCDMQEDRIGGAEAVVRQMIKRLPTRNYAVDFMGFAHVPHFKVPFMEDAFCAYPWFAKSKFAQKVDDFKPDHVFIVYQGFLAADAASYCVDNNIPFTGFYSAFAPEVVKKASGMPMWITRHFTNKFLSQATNVVVPTASMRDVLREEGFKHVIAWPHGIELDQFTVPTAEEKVAATHACGLEGLERPFYLYVGRVTPIKNLPAFFDIKLPGTKIVVGPEHDGFSIANAKKAYPKIIFVGPKRGAELAKFYQTADVFCLPSKLDSFGLVLLEALASGVPVVGFNTFGPMDVVPHGCGVSYLADDLNSLKEFEACALRAWDDVKNGVVTSNMCRAHAEKFSWNRAIDQLIDQVFVPVKYKK